MRLDKLNKCKIKTLVVILVALGLVSCQGSNLGNSLEDAIAPESPAPESSVDEYNAAPTSSAEQATSELLKSEHFGDRLPIFALASLSPWMNNNLGNNPNSLTNLPNNLSNNNQKSFLREYLYIDFLKSQKLSALANVASPTASSGDFSDLNKVPLPLQPWISDLYKLGTITPKIGQEFRPNTLIARREYAKWLLETNNRLYQSQPSRQIRLAQITDRPSFIDVPNKHPDFLIIQGLANAGLINTAGDRFFPDDPLSREEMVQWKIPLDLRQPFPSATVENIRQSWGFQDSDRISDSALGAIFADAQLRDLANIRRSFGFTTLLQPQKGITRAEAAASLWYFGTATDGISAARAIQNNNQIEK